MNSFYVDFASNWIWKLPAALITNALNPSRFQPQPYRATSMCIRCQLQLQRRIMTSEKLSVTAASACDQVVITYLADADRLGRHRISSFFSCCRYVHGQLSRWYARFCGVIFAQRGMHSLWTEWWLLLHQILRTFAVSICLCVCARARAPVCAAFNCDTYHLGAKRVHRMNYDLSMIYHLQTYFSFRDIEH